MYIYVCRHLEARLPRVAVNEDCVELVLTRPPLAGEAHLWRRAHCLVPDLLVPVAANRGNGSVPFTNTSLVFKKLKEKHEKNEKKGPRPTFGEGRTVLFQTCSYL